MLDKGWRVLFVGCYNLGPQGAELVREFYPDAAVVLWRKGDKAGRAEAKRIILSEPWDLIVSSYNDLIFSLEEIAAALLLINIHPSSPSLPGVGYDTFPLIEGHPVYEATLHILEKGDARIDAGPIVEVLTRELPPKTTYAELRKRNQELCLELLQWTLQQANAANSIESLEAQFRAAAARLGRVWGERYISYETLATTLVQLQASTPDHPVFVELPEEKLTYQRRSVVAVDELGKVHNAS